MGLTELVDFIFAENAEKNRARAAWDGYLEGISPEVCELSNGPIVKSDNKILPLQAADLLAWWVRKRWSSHGTTLPGENIELPWTGKHDIPWLAIEFNENDLRHELLKVRQALRRELTAATNVTFTWEAGVCLGPGS